MPNTPDGVATRPQDLNNLLVQLEEAQQRLGYLPQELLVELANSLGVSISEVYAVATFYSFLYTEPQGRYVIKVCKSLPCFLKNSRMIISSVEEVIGVKPGETTPDGKFSLQLTNCIGACDMAPAMMIDDRVYGDLTPGKISQILETYQ